MFVSPLKSGYPLCKAPLDGFSSRAVSQWHMGPGLEGRKGMEDPAAGLSVLGPGKPPAVTRSLGLRNRLCENGPCPSPSLCIHSSVSPLAWIIPVTIKLPIKTNFPLIIEKRKIKEKPQSTDGSALMMLEAGSFTASSALVVTTMQIQEASPPLLHRHCCPQTAPDSPSPRDPQNTSTSRAHSRLRREVWRRMDGWN